MAHMKPVAEYMVAYKVETNSHWEIVPQDACGILECLDPSRADFRPELLQPYLEGSVIYSVEREEGWYGRLSADGYLDCTEWDGPHATEDAALAAVQEVYDCDENGDGFGDGP